MFVQRTSYLDKLVSYAGGEVPNTLIPLHVGKFAGPFHSGVVCDMHPPKAPTVIDVVRENIRIRHYSLRTEKTYIGWIRRYIAFCGRRHPRDLGTLEITTFLTHLAVDRKVSASTQNQALQSLIFLYREVLQI